MDAPSSAYATLGIEPGADSQAIDRAYRRLIKRHHPDRKGGSAAKAAEINRAYAELRRQQQESEPSTRAESLAEAIYARRAGRTRVRAEPDRRLPWWPALAGVVAIVLIARGGEILRAVPQASSWLADNWSPVLDYRPGPSVDAPAPLDAPLDTYAIDQSILDAIELARRGDQDALADWTRDCHRRLREAPSPGLLDRCAAFEDAVVVIARRDPLHDQGPFSASAVTARQMGAATLLSNDYLAIEARLDRIRSRVEASLAPPPL